MNKVIQMGRLTKDPDLRYLSDNVAVCNFTIAVDRKYQKKGEDKKADFFNCVCFREKAELISKFWTKGRRILLMGNLQNRSYDDKEGIKRYVTEIFVDEVYFVDNKSEGLSQASNQTANNSFDPSGFNPEDSSDDLPF